jgi:ferredoxin-NADP reductase
MELIAPDYLEREVFCCGPTPYMSAVKRMLEAVGFDMKNYHEESFGATPPEAKADAVEHAELRPMRRKWTRPTSTWWSSSAATRAFAWPRARPCMRRRPRSA